jgi:hypothetical protein
MRSHRKAKAAQALGSINPADVANIAKANPYIQRLIEDADLREHVKTALDSTRSAFGRLSNGKAPAKTLFDDKKLHGDLQTAVGAIRHAADALSEGPKKRARKGFTFGRGLMIATIGGAVAMVGSESLRNKVLDTLFGAEEEFEYSPPTTPAPAEPPASPVSAV